jgi:O-antigen ligase
MSYKILTLTFILFLATITFVFAHKAFDSILPKDQLKKWRNSWYIITLIAFLSGSFWVYIIICGLYLIYASKREENVFALYFMLLLTIPPIDKVIPIIGLDHLFAMNYPRLISLTLLFPLFLSLRSKPDKIPFGRLVSDKFLIGIVILTFSLSLRGTTVSDAFRYGMSGFLDVFLPYYTASRVIKNMDQLKVVMIGFVTGCLVVAAIGIFEYRSFWLLYNTLDESLGVNWVMGGYLGRGDDLRAISTTGQPIILGYVVMVALGFYLYLAPLIKSNVIRLIGFGLIAAGLFVTLSRGPWVGAVALIIIFLATGTNLAKKFIIFITIALLTIPALEVIPGGHKILNILPFIGTSEQFNVEYRDKLFDRSLQVIEKHPVFGVFDARKEPEMQDMIQGEGIVDIVNAYLGVSLNQGLVGLFLFLGFFLSVLSATYKATKSLPKKSEERICGSSLIASLFGVLVTIYTVSTIGVIPIIYWSLAGLMLSYARVTSRTNTNVNTIINADIIGLTEKQSFPTTLIRK